MVKMKKKRSSSHLFSCAPPRSRTLWRRHFFRCRRCFLRRSCGQSQAPQRITIIQCEAVCSLKHQWCDAQRTREGNATCVLRSPPRASSSPLFAHFFAQRVRPRSCFKSTPCVQSRTHALLASSPQTSRPRKEKQEHPDRRLIRTRVSDSLSQPEPLDAARSL